MVTREQELKNRHNDLVEGKIRFWQHKVNEGQQRIRQATDSVEYSLEQLRSWEFFLATPATDNEQLLLNLTTVDRLTYAYKYVEAGKY